jgi:ParB-like chromosome segregation protein Spo0J
MNNGSSALSPDANLGDVPLHLITKDNEFWPRSGYVRGRVEEFAALYREAGALALPPVLLARLEEDRYRLVDGWHRLKAAGEAELASLPAALCPSEDDNELFDIAVELSAKGSSPLTVKEKRRVALDYLTNDDRELTDRWIASRTGLSPATVGKLRKRASLDSAAGAAVPSRPDPDAIGRESRARAAVAANRRLWETRGELAKYLGNETRGHEEMVVSLVPAFRHQHGDKAAQEAARMAAIYTEVAQRLQPKAQATSRAR